MMPDKPLAIEAIATFETNYVWAIHNGHDCALVDPGSSSEPLAWLEKHGLKLCALILTHHHHDHIGGVDDILRRFQVPVWGPQDSRMPQVTEIVAEGDEANVPELNLSLKVLETPGHTTTHIVYHNLEMLLAGDTLFSAGCGRLFEGTPEQMQNSLDKLADLPGTTPVYCAHEYTEDNCRFALKVEPDNQKLAAHAKTVADQRQQGKITLPSTLNLERAINPFLRTREPPVIQAAQQHEPNTSNDPATIFGVIRTWKDNS